MFGPEVGLVDLGKHLLNVNLKKKDCQQITHLPFTSKLLKCITNVYISKISDENDSLSTIYHRFISLLKVHNTEKKPL